MPINRLLSDINLTAEQRRVMELAFNSTLRKLSLVDRNDPVCHMVARKVIDLGALGYTNPAEITELTVKHFSGPA